MNGRLANSTCWRVSGVSVWPHNSAIHDNSEIPGPPESRSGGAVTGIVPNATGYGSPYTARVL